MSIRASAVVPRAEARQRQARPAPGISEARAVIRRQGATFSLACRLLPRGIRGDVYVLYAVFRTLDDLVDEHHPRAADRIEAVSAWAEGRPGEWTRQVKLLDDLMDRYKLDRRAIADFCKGMGRDLRVESFASEDDLDRYCYEVAGTVGIVMSGLLGTDGTPEAREAAVKLGMAMQRTNILRDLDEDSRAGRVYVSDEMITRYGWPAPGRRAAFVREQIAYADALYDQGLAGIGHLRHGRLAIAAAGQMYREILREIERRDDGEIPGRAVVSRPRKLAVAVSAVCDAARYRT